MGALGQTIVYLANPLTGSPRFSWFGHQVFEEGEEMSVRAGAGTWDITVSGFLLTLP